MHETALLIPTLVVFANLEASVFVLHLNVWNVSDINPANPVKVSLNRVSSIYLKHIGCKDLNCLILFV